MSQATEVFQPEAKPATFGDTALALALLVLLALGGLVLSSGTEALWIVLVSATILHVVRGESSSAVITFVMLVMATAVAYLRWRVAPIPPRA